MNRTDKLMVQYHPYISYMYDEYFNQNSDQRAANHLMNDFSLMKISFDFAHVSKYIAVLNTSNNSNEILEPLYIRIIVEGKPTLN